MSTSSTNPMALWLVLLSRTLLFAVFQILIAIVLSFANSPSPWSDSAGWWTFSALFTNLVSIMLLVWLFRRENKRYFEILSFSRQTLWKDIGITFLTMIVLLPLSLFPNQWLATWLFGSSEIAFSLFFRPLPLWAGLISILFPITIAFSELPTYFGYAMPRLEKQLSNGWFAWAAASFFLAFQHITLPLILDWRFMLWRFGMFAPLALLLGLCLKIRPQLLPYFMIVIVLQPDSFSEDGDSWALTNANWNIVGEVFQRYTTEADTVANFKALRGAIFERIKKYPTLNDTDGVLMVTMTGEGGLQNVTERNKEAVIYYKMQTLRFVIRQQIPDLTGGEY